MKNKQIVGKMYKYLTVKNMLIAIIGILVLIIIFQNIHRFWWSRQNHNFGWSNNYNASQMKFPWIMWWNTAWLWWGRWNKSMGGR